MDIVLVGSGNVATVLGRKSIAAGHRVVQVYSPNTRNSNELAIRLGTSSTSYISSIERTADLMIIAIRDAAISSFAKDLGAIKSIVVHTAGAQPLHILEGTGSGIGILYPIQSLRKEIEIIPPLSLLTDGDNHFSRAQIRNFALTLTDTVSEADDATRLKYHLAATFVNNFANHLFVMANAFCEKENISFALLQPLMEETVKRLRNNKPASSQTGPAIRNDTDTLEKHRQLIKDYPALANFYEIFTAEIQQSALEVKL